MAVVFLRKGSTWYPEPEPEVAPTVNNATFNISTTYTSFQPVGTATLSNSPNPSTVTWSITAGNNDAIFEITPSTGLIAVANPSLLTVTTYSLTVQASNGVSPAGTGTITIPCADGSAARRLYDLTFVNQSASVQTANVVWFPFGLWFRDGDLAGDAYPQLKEAGTGTVRPITVGARTLHPSGNTEWLACAMRGPGVSGSGTQVIEVWNGGSAPSASGYTQANSDIGDVTMSLTGEASGNFDGTWTAGMDDLRTNPIRSFTFMDGDAGAFFVTDGHFKQSGSAHGVAEMRAYWMACKGASGKLGYRFLGMFKLWHCDISNTLALPRTLTGALYKEGATNKVRDLTGYSGANGAQVLGSVIRVPHYASFFSCDVAGEYDWIQGDGSVASEPCTMGHPTFDYEYFRGTKLLPPYPLGLTVTNALTVESYYPMGKGGVLTDTATNWNFTQTESGMINHNQAVCLLRQSQNDFRTLKTTGLSCAGWRTHLRRSTTGQPVDGGNGSDDAGAQWTGLGASLPAGRYQGHGGGAGGGITNPGSGNSSVFGGNDALGSHRPMPVLVPYRLLARPEFLDLLVNIGFESVLTYPGGTTGATLKTPPISQHPYVGSSSRHINFGGSNYYCSGLLAQVNLSRVPAQILAAVAYAYKCIPETNPEGVATKAALNRMLDRAASFYIDAYLPSRSAAYQATGLISFQRSFGESFPYIGYLASVVAWVAATTQKTKWLALNNHMASLWQALDDASDISVATGYANNLYDQNEIQIEDVDYLLSAVAGPTVTSDTSTNRLTVSGYVPADGDRYMWSGSPKPSTAIANYEVLFAINTSGQTLQLARSSAPTTPISFDTSGTVSGGNRMYVALANGGSLNSFQTGQTGPDTQFDVVWGAMKIQNAAGATVHSTAKGKMDARSPGPSASNLLRMFADTFEAA